MLKILSRVLLLTAALACIAAAAGAQDLKIATVVPDNSAWMVAMRHGGDEIRERTAGRVNLKFYGGGVMGNDQSVLRKIRIGQLQGGAFTAGGLSGVCPELGLYSFPLLFKSTAEIDFVRLRRDPAMAAALESAGFVSYGFAEGGFALLMSEGPVRTLEDLKGQKIWVPEGDVISYRTMQMLGLAPVSLPLTDVMTGLQTGLVNIFASSPVGALAFQWYTRVGYITDLPLSYIYGALALDRRAVARLAPADQAVLQEVMGRIYREFDRKNREDNRAALQVLLQQGLKLVTPQEAETRAWRARTSTLARQLRDEGLFDGQLFDRILQDLEELRGRTAAVTDSR